MTSRVIGQPSSFADLERTALFCTIVTRVKITMKDNLHVYSHSGQSNCESVTNG